MYTCTYFHVFLTTVQLILTNLRAPVEVYPTNVNPIELYPIEAYLIGKGAVEVSGCHRIAVEPYSSKVPLLQVYKKE
jgi:hypothetical protein